MLICPLCFSVEENDEIVLCASCNCDLPGDVPLEQSETLLARFTLDKLNEIKGRIVADERLRLEYRQMLANRLNVLIEMKQVETC